METLVSQLPKDPLTHYVVVRRDLPLGVIAAQLVHAAGESSPGNLPEGTFAIALAAPDEAALVALAARLKTAGVLFVEVREPDLPYDGALMALGVRPNLRSELRRHFAEIPLLKEMGTLAGFPNPPATGSGGQSPPTPNAKERRTVRRDDDI